MFLTKLFRSKEEYKQIEYEPSHSLINAIKQLENGDKSYLHIAYCSMACKDHELIKQTGSAITNIVKNYNSKQMIRFDEEFRRFTSMEWNINWNLVVIPSFLYFNDKQDYVNVLILGSFHPNGYYREKCILELGQYNDTLPYVILRMNDWVVQVRERAYHVAIKKVKACSIHEILKSIAFLEKVKKSQRKDCKQFEHIEEEIKNRLKKEIFKLKWFEITQYDFFDKKSIYTILFSEPILTQNEANQLLEQEKNTYCKSLIISRILTIYKCPINKVQQYLQSDNSFVRKHALQHLYKRILNTWDGLEDMLLDENYAIREYTRFILKKHSQLNVLQFYIGHLQDNNPNVAIIGVGECGNKECISLLLPFLQIESDKTLKVTIGSLSKLYGIEGFELYHNYLFDTRISISKAAYHAIRSNEIRYGSDRLYTEFSNCNIEHVKRFLLLLLMKGKSWERLPYLLKLYNYHDTHLREKIRVRINKRNVYDKLTKEEGHVIREVLKEVQDIIPEYLKESIEFDLKYVLGK